MWCFDIQIFLRDKTLFSPSMEWRTGGTLRLRLFLFPILPSSPILIMRVVWFDNLETVLTNKDQILDFLDSNSKKCILFEGTLRTWFHYSNLNPNSAFEFSILRKEVWENSGVSLSPTLLSQILLEIMNVFQHFLFELILIFSG